MPTRRQYRALECVLEGQRQLYNGALEERIEAYRKAGIARTYIDQCKALTEWRKSDPEAASVPANLQRWTLKCVDTAHEGYFKRLKAGEKPGFPRFRSRSRFDTFGFREFSGIQFHQGRVRFKGMPGGIRVHQHRPLPSGCAIKCCVIRRDVKGWTIGFMIETIEGDLRRDGGMVGIDLGVTTFAAISDGGFIPSLRATRQAQRRMRAAERALARKASRSKSRRKAREGLARCRAAVARARANHLHQASARIVRDYRLIVVEKLNVKGLARSALAKDVYDAGWAKFISMLRYKAACAGSQIIEVECRNTSQQCSCCGNLVPKKLDERLHQCGHCGLRIDRDLNAARNILYRAGVGPGLHNVVDCDMRAGGNLDLAASSNPCA